MVLNQVLVSFGDTLNTQAVIKKIQEDVLLVRRYAWQGKTAMRISVSSWSTTEMDVDLSLAAMLKAADEVISSKSKIQTEKNTGQSA